MKCVPGIVGILLVVGCDTSTSAPDGHVADIPSTDSGPSAMNADADSVELVELDGASPADSSVSKGPEDDSGVTPMNQDASFADQVVWGIPVTGQSLAVGTNSDPIHLTTQYSNLKLGFDVTNVPWVSTRLVPCGEPLRPWLNSSYPYNVKGETTSTIMGDQLSYLSILNTSEDYVTYHGNFGGAGWAMKFINKNGVGTPAPRTPDNFSLGYSFQAMLDEFAIAKSLVEATGKKFRVRASILTHGESDFASTTYKEELKQLAADQRSDLFAITSQASSDPFHLIATQPSAGYPNGNDDTLSTSANLMWMASLEDSAIVIAGPKYQYGYSADRIHMLAPGYDHLGVKYAQVYDRLANGGTWTPMQPIGIAVNEKVIQVDLHVPVLPFSFDETLDPNQVTHLEWKNGRGFEVVDDTGKLVIESVAKGSASSLAITLATLPGSGLRLRYAMTNDGIGRRGQVADSDPFIGIDTKNYSVSFTQGSTEATLNDPMPEHGARDCIVASGLPLGTLIKNVSGNTLTLSNPWGSASTTTSASVHFDNRNYLVQFDLPVPWRP